MRLIQKFIIGSSFVLLAMVALGVIVQSMSDDAKAQTQASDSFALAYSARFVGDDEITRIIVDFTRTPKLNIFYMELPNRLVVELENGAFQVENAHEISTVGLINSARAGSITKTKARLVLSLLNPATIASQEIQLFDGSTRQRLVLELAKIDQSEFQSKINAQKQLLGKSGGVAKKGDRVRPPQKRQGEFTIIIDPGHGGIDGGAVGQKKTLEKNVTLAVANLIGQYLPGAGPFNTVFTRKDDVFVSLKERLAITKRNRADLMISLHADTLKQKHVRGATIYTLAKKASDRLSAQLASSENLADLVAGLAAPQSKDEVTDILADLTLRETTKFSKAFSGILKNRMAEKVTMIKNPQRAASFAVLKNLEVPSVLLELGYLSNKDDEILFNDPQWQDKAALQIVAAIADFFKNRSPTSN